MGERLAPYSLIFMAEDTQEDLPEIDKDPAAVFAKAEQEAQAILAAQRKREELENNRRQFLKEKMKNPNQLNPEERKLIGIANSDIPLSQFIKILDSSETPVNFKEALVQNFVDNYALRNTYKPGVPEQPLNANYVIKQLREHRPLPKGEAVRT